MIIKGFLSKEIKAEIVDVSDNGKKLELRIPEQTFQATFEPEIPLDKVIQAGIPIKFKPGTTKIQLDEIDGLQIESPVNLERVSEEEIEKIGKLGVKNWTKLMQRLGDLEPWERKQIMGEASPEFLEKVLRSKVVLRRRLCPWSVPVWNEVYVGEKFKWFEISGKLTYEYRIIEEFLPKAEKYQHECEPYKVEYYSWEGDDTELVFRVLCRATDSQLPWLRSKSLPRKEMKRLLDLVRTWDWEKIKTLCCSMLIKP